MSSAASDQISSVTAGLSLAGLRSYRGLAALAIFILCAAITIGLDGPPPPLPENASPAVFSAARAVKHLAVISREPHPVNSPAHDAVRDYILGAFRETGLAPEVQRAVSANGVPLENIVCRLKGSSPEKAVLMVAHYDSVPTGPGAADDGSSVAGLLETARALKSLPAPKRDIIFLITDGEERGLLGAKAFVDQHPWAHDAGIVLNFEARGTGGASIMFETSDRNGWLIGNLGQAASHPVANSLSYEIYKRLPNNTDFTVFKRAGFSGLNFAFIDGLARYHTPGDSLANLDTGSLQQQGDYMLALAKQFGNASENDPRPGNVVYFDLLGGVLVQYGQSMAIFLLVLAAALLLTVFYMGVRRKQLKISGSLLGLVFMVLAAGAAIVACWIASQLVLALRASLPGIRAGLMYHTGSYISAYALIGLAAAMAVYALASRWIDSRNLALGALSGWFVITILISIALPGGSYLFLWPLLFSLCGWLLVFWKSSASTPWIRGNRLLLILCGIPAIVVVVPMVHKMFLAFAWQSGLIVSMFSGLLLALLIGQITPEAMPRRWLASLLLAVLGIGLLLTAVLRSKSNVENSRMAPAQHIAAGIQGERLQRSGKR
jgi:uncharacterized membrane protein